MTRLFIGGSWEEARSGDSAAATSPATGESLGPVAQGDREDARRAIAAARDAFPGWARASAFERAAALRRIADVCEARRDELARVCTLDQGKPLTESYDEVDELVAMWRGSAEDGLRIEGSIPPSSGAGKRILVMRRARCSGTRVRQHGRVEPGAEHRRVLRRPRRLHRGGGPAAGRLQLRARAGPGGGR